MNLSAMTIINHYDTIWTLYDIIHDYGHDSALLLRV